ncbi:MAG: type IV pilus assembly protein PilM [Candidatus Shapirobacteria bacterium]|jgi:type IV pilus assembly protein PilM
MSDFFGIDLGVGTTKIVALTKDQKGTIILDGIGETRTPNIDWQKGGAKGKALSQMTDAVKSLISDLRLKARQTVATLPEDEVVSRLINLPPLKETEIRDALKFEAETFVPYPLDQVSIDYEVVEQDEGGRLSVFAIAARNDLIQSYIKLFKNMGLELIALESPAVSMKRAVNLSIPQVGGAIVVDMGEKYSDIIGLANGNIRFTRSMSVGGESLTRAISINLSLDMASAEEYKKAYGMKEMELEGKIKAAITPVFSSMAEEIRRAMTLFAEERGKAADILVLSGGGANLPGLAEELTRTLGIEVQVIQPFVKIDTSKINVPINLNSDGCRFSIAVGSALRGLV